METELLRDFVEVAKNLNLTKAARDLNFTQSTLSKHISTLEDSIKLRLFDRTTASFHLTHEGTELLAHAFKILNAVEDFNDCVQALRSSSTHGQILVSGLLNDELAATFLGHVLSQLSSKYGNNIFQERDNGGKSISQELEEKRADIVFDYTTQGDFDDSSHIETITLGTYSWYILVRKNHPIAQCKSVSLEELSEETFLKIEGSRLGNAWRYIDKACERHGFKPRIARQYSMRPTDLIANIANLGDTVMIIGENHFRANMYGIAPFCDHVPIIDEDTFFPFSAIYLANNDNVLLREALSIAKNELAMNR